MAKQLQLRRGTTTEHNTFTGAQGELTYDTTRKQLMVHDGSTVGGLPTTDNYLAFMPIPYPKSTPPVGYLALMGQTISQITYPILYSLYGATLPDLRGQFLRGLDYGKGIDEGRVVLSSQGDAIRDIQATFTGSNIDASFPITGAVTGVRGVNQYPDTGRVISESNLTFKASNVVPTANENRPKNISFLYIVKAG